MTSRERETSLRSLRPLVGTAMRICGQMTLKIIAGRETKLGPSAPRQGDEER